MDHQSGLISLVQDFTPDEFKNNVLALADIAKYFKLPTILTTSFEQGPNGPLMPELKEMFPKSPYIPRPGQINAWDNEDFVKAIKQTGRKQLIIAGVVTDVCEAALTRVVAAGAQLMNWFSIACELHRDWRNDVEGLATLLSNHLPAYRNLMTSYNALTKIEKR